MLNQISHPLCAHFALLYENHLIVPELALVINYEMDQHQVYNLSPDTIHYPVFHAKLLARTNALFSDPDRSDEEVNKLIKDWADYRSRAALFLASWVAVSKADKSIRLYTPGCASLDTLEFCQGEQVRVHEEYLHVPALQSDHKPMLLTPNHVPMSDDLQSLLCSGILTPAEVADRLIPKLFKIPTKYIAISLA